MKFSEKEIELGVGLIDRLTSEEFNPENYKDEYRIRVLAMLDEKSKGKEIVTNKAPAPKHGQVIDIMEALKRSMESGGEQTGDAFAAKKIKNVVGVGN